MNDVPFDGSENESSFDYESTNPDTASISGNSFFNEYKRKTHASKKEDSLDFLRRSINNIDSNTYNIYGYLKSNLSSKRNNMDSISSSIKSIQQSISDNSNNLASTIEKMNESTNGLDESLGEVSEKFSEASSKLADVNNSIAVVGGVLVGVAGALAGFGAYVGWNTAKLGASAVKGTAKLGVGAAKLGVRTGVGAVKMGLRTQMNMYKTGAKVATAPLALGVKGAKYAIEQSDTSSGAEEVSDYFRKLFGVAGLGLFGGGVNPLKAVSTRAVTGLAGSGLSWSLGKGRDAGNYSLGVVGRQIRGVKNIVGGGLGIAKDVSGKGLDVMSNSLNSIKNVSAAGFANVTQSISSLSENIGTRYNNNIISEKQIMKNIESAGEKGLYSISTDGKIIGPKAKLANVEEKKSGDKSTVYLSLGDMNLFKDEGEEKGFFEKIGMAVSDAFTEFKKTTFGSFGTVLGLRQILAYTIPAFGMGFKSELPNIRRLGLFASLYRVLTLSYVHQRFASQESNFLLTQIGNILLRGFGIKGTMIRPGFRTISQMIGENLRELFFGKRDITFEGMMQKQIDDFKQGIKKTSDSEKESIENISATIEDEKLTLLDVTNVIKNTTKDIYTLLMESWITKEPGKKGGLDAYADGTGDKPVDKDKLAFIHKGEIIKSKKDVKEDNTEEKKKGGFFSNLFGGIFGGIMTLFSKQFWTNISDSLIGMYSSITGSSALDKFVKNKSVVAKEENFTIKESDIKKKPKSFIGRIYTTVYDTFVAVFDYLKKQIPDIFSKVWDSMNFKGTRKNRDKIKNVLSKMGMTGNESIEEIMEALEKNKSEISEFFIMFEEKASKLNEIYEKEGVLNENKRKEGATEKEKLSIEEELKKLASERDVINDKLTEKDIKKRNKISKTILSPIAFITEEVVFAINNMVNSVKDALSKPVEEKGQYSIKEKLIKSYQRIVPEMLENIIFGDKDFTTQNFVEKKIGLIPYIIKQFEKTGDLVQSLVSAPLDIFGSIVEYFKSIKDDFVSIWSGDGTILNKFGTTILSPIIEFKTILDQIFTSLKNVVSELLEFTFLPIQYSFHKKHAEVDIKSFVSDKILPKSISEIIKDILEVKLDFFMAGWKSFDEFFSGVGSIFSKEETKINKTIKLPFKKDPIKLKSFWTAYRDIKKKKKGIAGDIIGSFAGFLNILALTFKPYYEPLENVGNRIKTSWRWLLDEEDKMHQFYELFFKEWPELLKNSWSDMISAVKDVTNILRDKGSDKNEEKSVEKSVEKEKTKAAKKSRKKKKKDDGSIQAAFYGGVVEKNDIESQIDKSKQLDLKGNEALIIAEENETLLPTHQPDFMEKFTDAISSAIAENAVIRNISKIVHKISSDIEIIIGQNKEIIDNTKLLIMPILSDTYMIVKKGVGLLAALTNKAIKVISFITDFIFNRKTRKDQYANEKDLSKEELEELSRKKLMRTLDEILDGVISIGKNTKDFAVNVIKKLPETIKKASKYTVDKITGAITKVKEKIGNISDRIGSIKDWFSKIKEKIFSPITAVIEEIKNTYKRAKDFVKKKISEAIGVVTGQFLIGVDQNNEPIRVLWPGIIIKNQFRTHKILRNEILVELKGLREDFKRLVGIETTENKFDLLGLKREKKEEKEKKKKSLWDKIASLRKKEEGVNITNKVSGAVSGSITEGVTEGIIGGTVAKYGPKAILLGAIGILGAAAAVILSTAVVLGSLGVSYTAAKRMLPENKIAPWLASGYSLAGAVIGGIIGLSGGVAGVAAGAAGGAIIGGAVGSAMVAAATTLDKVLPGSSNLTIPGAGIGAIAGAVMGGVIAGVMSGGALIPVGIAIGGIAGGAVGMAAGAATSLIEKYIPNSTKSVLIGGGIGAVTGAVVGGIIAGVVSGGLLIPVGVAVGGLVGGALGMAAGASVAMFNNFRKSMIPKGLQDATGKKKIGVNIGSIVGGIVGLGVGMPGLGAKFGSYVGALIGGGMDEFPKKWKQAKEVFGKEGIVGLWKWLLDEIKEIIVEYSRIAAEDLKDYFIRKVTGGLIDPETGKVSQEAVDNKMSTMNTVMKYSNPAVWATGKLAYKIFGKKKEEETLDEVIDDANKPKTSMMGVEQPTSSDKMAELDVSRSMLEKDYEINANKKAMEELGEKVVLSQKDSAKLLASTMVVTTNNISKSSMVSSNNMSGGNNTSSELNSLVDLLTGHGVV